MNPLQEFVERNDKLIKLLARKASNAFGLSFNDALQEAYLVVMNTHSKYNGSCAESTWIWNAVWRRMIDLARVEGRRKRRFHSTDFNSNDGFGISVIEGWINDFLDNISDDDARTVVNLVLHSGLEIIKPSGLKKMLKSLGWTGRKINAVLNRLRRYCLAMV